jgi:WD40 repeat protein
MRIGKRLSDCWRKDKKDCGGQHLLTHSSRSVCVEPALKRVCPMPQESKKETGEAARMTLKNRMRTQRDAQKLPAFAMALAICWLAAGVAAPAQGSTSLYGSSPSKATADWDYDGTRILGHIGNDVYVWDAQTGRVLHKLAGHGERIDTAQFTPDGRHALTSSYINGGELCSGHLPQFHSKDTSVRLWDLESGKQVWKLDRQIEPRLSPDGNRLLTVSLLTATDPDCGTGAGVAMWDTARGRPLFTMKPEDMPGCGVATFSPDGRSFVCVWGHAVLYDARDGREIGMIPRVNSFNFYDGNSLAVSAPDGFEIWDTVGKLERKIPYLRGSPWGGPSAWTHDGSRMVSLVSEGTVREGSHWACRMDIWNVASGQIAAQLPCDPYAIYSRPPLISPDGKRLLLAWGGTNVENKEIPAEVDLFDTESGKEVTRIENGVGALGFSPDGRTFLLLDRPERADDKEGGQYATIYSSESGKLLVKVALAGETGAAALPQR